MNRKPKIGLALSGGGYRAAAFHLGTLRKLNQLNILNSIQILSTISGGSIAGAYYCLNKNDFTKFEKGFRKTLTTKSIIKYVMFSISFIRFIFFIAVTWFIIIYLFVHNFLWTPIILICLFFYLLIRFQFRIFPVSRTIEHAYNKFFFNNAKLSDLPDAPELAVGSTNLQTARHFTFSKRKMDDSSYAYAKPPIYFKNENFPIARAVIASSCVPFAFTPIHISKKYFVDEGDFNRIKPRLIDGGVYDNQGIHKLTQHGSSYECDIVITSDAGNKLPFEGAYNNTLILLIRTVDVFMTRIKNFQMIQNLYNRNNLVKKEIAYLSLGWNLEDSIPDFVLNIKNGNINKNVIKAHKIEEEWLNNIDQFGNEIIEYLKKRIDYSRIFEKKLSSKELEIARKVGTNLTCLSIQQVNCLIRHAENLTELQVKLYCPSLFNN